MFLDVAPDLDQIPRSFRRKQVPPTHSGLGFQLPEISLQLVLRNSLSTIKLVNATLYLGFDSFSVFPKASGPAPPGFLASAATQASN